MKHGIRVCSAVALHRDLISVLGWIASSSNRFHSWKEPLSKMPLSILLWVNVCFPHKVPYLLNKFKKSLHLWLWLRLQLELSNNTQTKTKRTRCPSVALQGWTILWNRKLMLLLSSGGRPGLGNRWFLGLLGVFESFAGAAAVWFPGSDWVNDFNGPSLSTVSVNS